MENWRAGLFALGIVLIGLGGYSSLDGVWKGLSLVASGVALVLLGLSLDRGAHAARSDAGPAETEPETGPEPAEAGPDLDATAPTATVDAEPTVPLARTQVEAPAGHPAEGLEAGAAAEPETAEPAEEVEPAADVEPVAEPAAASAEEGRGEDDTAHVHDNPMLGHSELVSHIRDYHAGVPFDGSTIQLRLLHERAHA